MSLIVGPRLEDVVVAVLFDIFKPALHVAVVAVDQRGVAVVKAGAPRSLDDEAAPVGSASGTEGGCYVRQLAVGLHGVGPGLHPVGVGGAYIPKCL